MRCQRKSGFQESRRERVAQINETVEVGLKIKNSYNRLQKKISFDDYFLCGLYDKVCWG